MIEPKLIGGVAIFVLLVGGLIWVVQRDNPIEWWHFIATKGKDGERGDINKLGQVVGIATSSWAVIVEAYGNHLDAFILAAYLAFVGGVSGYSAYLRSRGGNDNSGTVLPRSRGPSGEHTDQREQPSGEG